jgi:hypothetical protein
LGLSEEKTDIRVFLKKKLEFRSFGRKSWKFRSFGRKNWNVDPSEEKLNYLSFQRKTGKNIEFLP